MRKLTILLLFLVFLVCLVPGAFANEPGTSPDLQLVPEPKEVRLQDGGFRLAPGTKIFVQLGHQQEDRIAAETLAEQVENQSGIKLDIVGTKPSSKAEDGAIMLVRLPGSRVRRFLEEKGLIADGSVGEQGYLLFSDKSHLIVAANTGQGLFSGVQTLRQLLRSQGNGLICPAVAIRDWPNAVKDGTGTVVGKGTTPPLVMRFRGPRA